MTTTTATEASSGDDPHLGTDIPDQPEPRLGIAIAGVAVVLTGLLSMLDDSGAVTVDWWPPAALGVAACAILLARRTLKRLTQSSVPPHGTP